MQPRDRERIIAVLQARPDDPFAGNIEHLKNEPAAFRRRLGDWRILLDPALDRRLIVIVEIRRRSSKTYRRR